jgi:thiamine monophosphate kinase
MGRKMTRTDNVVALIVSGELDNDIDKIRNAIRYREKQKADQIRSNIKEGDIVVMTGEGTRYLAGVKCRVDKKLKKNFKVTIIDEGVYFRGAKTFSCPPELFQPAPTDAPLEPIA